MNYCAGFDLHYNSYVHTGTYRALHSDRINSVNCPWNSRGRCHFPHLVSNATSLVRNCLCNFISVITRLVDYWNFANGIILLHAVCVWVIYWYSIKCLVSNCAFILLIRCLDFCYAFESKGKFVNRFILVSRFIEENEDSFLSKIFVYMMETLVCSLRIVLIKFGTSMLCSSHYLCACS